MSSASVGFCRPSLCRAQAGEVARGLVCFVLCLTLCSWNNATAATTAANDDDDVSSPFLSPYIHR